MTRRAVASFDPDAEFAPSGDGVVPDDVWIEPGWEDGHAEEAWVDPFDTGPDLDTPTARADWAYGCAVETSTPTEVLSKVVADLVTWDVDALLSEMHDGVGEQPDPRPADRPDVVVLRSLLRHPNRPDDLSATIVAGWLDDTSRPPWTLLVALAAEDPVPDDDLVTVVTEACDAARTDDPPDWTLLVAALAWGRGDGDAVRDLLALVPFPHEQPVRLWPDALDATRGMPGGVRDRATRAGEGLGWDGRRLPALPEAVVAALETADRRQRASSFEAQVTLCEHGPVLLTPTAVELPQHARGEKPYIALIVGSHPVFRMKRDWPDRADEGRSTAWSWRGARVLETRGLGCDACRVEPDRGKAYFVTDGTRIARLPARLLHRVLEAVEQQTV